jgi:predicted RND superfamily exporter protein
MLVAALTTVLGFGTLMTSSHRGLVGLGLILSLGVACCMLTALVFLPALLRLLSQDHPAAEVPATAEPEIVTMRRAA